MGLPVYSRRQHRDDGSHVGPAAPLSATQRRQAPQEGQDSAAREGRPGMVVCRVPGVCGPDRPDDLVHLHLEVLEPFQNARRNDVRSLRQSTYHSEIPDAHMVHQSQERIGSRLRTRLDGSSAGSRWGKGDSGSRVCGLSG
jgi:hypothetical protein